MNPFFLWDFIYICRSICSLSVPITLILLIIKKITSSEDYGFDMIIVITITIAKRNIVRYLLHNNIEMYTNQLSNYGSLGGILSIFGNE